MIRRLDPEVDGDLYRQCWEWRTKYPRALRDATAVDSVDSFEEFIDQSRGARADIGIFDSEYRFMEELIACVSIQWKADGVYEIHMAAKRGSRIEQMVEPFLNIQKTIFEELGARFIFAFTPEWNRGLILLSTIIGMEPDGVRRIRGTTRGRAITWVRLSQSRAQYEQHAKTNADANGYRSVFAAGQFNQHDHASSEYSGYRSAA